MKRLLQKNPTRTWNNDKKLKIAKDMLERYSGCSVNEFGKYVIITNFEYYLDCFSKKFNKPIKSGSALRVCHNKKSDISMVCFNIGAPMSALVIEMLSSYKPKGVLMLGMCGGLHRGLKIGDFFLPMAAIRNEGTSQHFFPPQVPALPTFAIQKMVSQVITDASMNYFTGVVHTTDYRFWEFDDSFKTILQLEKAGAIDMETATLFITAFGSKVPCGALLLVSDLPLKEVKTKASANRVFRDYTDMHLDIGLQSMLNMDSFEEASSRHFTW